MNSILRRQFSSTVSLRNSSTTRVLSPIALPQAFFTPLVLPRTFFSYPIRTVKKSPVSSWFVLAGGWVFAIVTAGTLNYKLTVSPCSSYIVLVGLMKHNNEFAESKVQSSTFSGAGSSR